jgi:hypothetical protein
MFQNRKVEKNIKDAVIDDMNEPVILDLLQVEDDEFTKAINHQKKNDCIGFFRNDFQVNYFTKYKGDLYLKSN